MRNIQDDLQFVSNYGEPPGKDLAHYYAVDQCDADYIAIVESDNIMYARHGYSWVEEAILGLRDTRL